MIPEHHNLSWRLHKLYTSCQNDALYYTICLTIIVANISLFCYGLWFQIHQPVVGISNYLLPVGRGFGVTLELNCVLIILPMCHAWATFLRRWSFFALIIPFGYLHSLHIFLSRLIGIGVLVHGGLQICHFISASIIENPDKVWTTSLRGGISVFTTGMLCTVVLFTIIFFAVKKIRSKLRFEVFFYSHHLYLVFYALLLLHGQRAGRIEFYKWFLVPGFLYVTDRIYRLITGHCYNRHCKPVSLKYYPNSKVTRLEIPKLFNYSPGQYAELKIPQISAIQGHPFTIASSPQEDNMVFFIKVAGRWTKQLAEFAQDLDDIKELTVLVSGPFGAPAQFSFHFDHLLFISAGIGATPFVSAMKHAANMCNDSKPSTIQDDHEIAVDWAKNHMQTIDWVEDIEEFTLQRSESTMSIETIYSEDVFQPGVTLSQRVHRAGLKVYNFLSSIIYYIAQLWVVLLCVLLSALSLIFFGGGLNGFAITVFVFLGLLVISLSLEFCLELYLHGIYHYFKTFKRFFSLLDVPICMSLVTLCIISEVLQEFLAAQYESLLFTSFTLLYIYLFVRLTLRVGSRNVLQLPHAKKVTCVRSVDFVWVNKTNGDTEWMLDDLRELDDHQKNCKSQCSSGLSFHHDLYLTREEVQSKEPFRSIQMHQGRPDWDRIFTETTNRFLSHTNQVGNTIGVFFCGPPLLGDALKHECIVHTIKTRIAGNPIYFIYHQEIF